MFTRDRLSGMRRGPTWTNRASAGQVTALPGANGNLRPFTIAKAVVIGNLIMGAGRRTPRVLEDHYQAPSDPAGLHPLVRLGDTFGRKGFGHPRSQLTLGD